MVAEPCIRCQCECDGFNADDEPICESCFEYEYDRDQAMREDR